MKRIVLASILPLLAGCSAAPPFAVVDMVQEWASYMNRDHVLVPGDLIVVSAFQTPELTQEVTVAPEGTVSLKRLGDPVRAAGTSVSEFRATVEQAYRKSLPGTEISVNLKKPNAKMVYVAGELFRPGPIPWHDNLTLGMAIAAAGGFRITAKPSDVLVVRAMPATGAPRSIRVNVDAILYGKSADLLVLPGDVIWAQTSAIADVGNWVELYIRRLLPFDISGAAVPVGN